LQATKVPPPVRPIESSAVPSSIEYVSRGLLPTTETFFLVPVLRENIGLGTSDNAGAAGGRAGAAAALSLATTALDANILNPVPHGDAMAAVANVANTRTKAKIKLRFRFSDRFLLNIRIQSPLIFWTVLKCLFRAEGGRQRTGPVRPLTT